MDWVFSEDLQVVGSSIGHTACIGEKSYVFEKREVLGGDLGWAYFYEGVRHVGQDDSICGLGKEGLPREEAAFFVIDCL